VEGIPGLAIDAGSATPGRLSSAVTGDQPALAGTDEAALGAFTRFALTYARQRPGRPVAVLHAGCTISDGEFDLAPLRADGHDVEVSYVDDQSPATRAAVAARPDLHSALLGEMRLVPLRPRSFDIVHCSLLLHRINHAEVVLGRLAAAVRPGGLLMLRISDPASAAGFLDRRMPEYFRRVAWRRAWPGQPGPYPAIYEAVASSAGIEAFISRHGLAVAHRERTNSYELTRPPAPARMVTWLSRGRLGCDHDELRYIVRKPEDRFARVLQ
jgi:SAM-dependent methyltransferase